MDGEAYITNHGRKRVRQRIGVPSRAVQRLADRALREGLRHGDIAGAMGRWLDSLYLRSQGANNMRIFGDKVFLFCGDPGHRRRVHALGESVHDEHGRGRLGVR